MYVVALPAHYLQACSLWKQWPFSLFIPGWRWNEHAESILRAAEKNYKRGICWSRSSSIGRSVGPDLPLSGDLGGAFGFPAKRR